MASFFANYGYNSQTEWYKERDVQNPGATMYAHWMQLIHEQAKESLQKTREVIGQYYDRKAKQQPDINIGDLVMLNGKDICTKRPLKNIA